MTRRLRYQFGRYRHTGGTGSPKDWFYVLPTQAANNGCAVSSKPHGQEDER